MAVALIADPAPVPKANFGSAGKVQASDLPKKFRSKPRKLSATKLKLLAKLGSKGEPTAADGAPVRHSAAREARRELPPLRTEPQVDPLPYTRGWRERGRTSASSTRGRAVPLHRGGQGAARVGEAWREEVLEQRLESFTNRTLTGPEWLRRELARTVVRGYSIEDREFEPDARGVGAPVFSGTGEAVAAGAVVAPTPRLPKEHFGEIGEAVMQAAGSLSQQLRSDGRNQA